MNKLVFQIGLLVFCVSVVYFGTQGLDAIQMVSRSFMVFMVVVSGLVVLAMVVSSSIRAAKHEAHKEDPGEPSARKRTNPAVEGHPSNN
jgi:hypothetical protein